MVVTADHGISFRPGHGDPRIIGRGNDPGIMWVPLFIKEPGQTQGPGSTTATGSTSTCCPPWPTTPGCSVPWPVDGPTTACAACACAAARPCARPSGPATRTAGRRGCRGTSAGRSRVLAEQAGLVAAVQRRVAQPGRQGAGGGQLLLGPGGGHPDQGQLLPQLQLAGVGEPEHEPGPAHRHPVAAQRLLVALPHQDRRVVAPAVAGGGQGPQHLERLDPLLAETAWVEGPGAGGELGIGQERLQGHGSPVLARARRRLRRGSMMKRAMAAAAK